ncbi:biliverdin-producing heme oxygenase [Variovorax sp. LT1R16]|uniref:biliverdin-producing heme oxygenase n=1 Tax=Variovorax sp. LT1R16 TaxID=3443728 RepID=UPI003F475045
MPTDILDALRAATGALHAEVDQCLPLSSPSPSLSDYRAHLRLLDAWMHRLAVFAPEPSPLAAHHAQVADDLRLCDALLPAEPSPHDVDTASESVHCDAAFVWGLAYVLEGSRLGGRVLYRQLAERLAPHPLNYLQGAGEQTGASWKAFIAGLRAQPFTPDAVRSACDGAVHAFDLLLQCHRRAEACA